LENLHIQCFDLIFSPLDRATKVVYTLKFLRLLNEYLLRNTDFPEKMHLQSFPVFWKNLACDYRTTTNYKKNLL